MSIIGRAIEKFQIDLTVERSIFIPPIKGWIFLGRGPDAEYFLSGDDVESVRLMAVKPGGLETTVVGQTFPKFNIWSFDTEAFYENDAGSLLMKMQDGSYSPAEFREFYEGSTLRRHGKVYLIVAIIDLTGCPRILRGIEVKSNEEV